MAAVSVPRRCKPPCTPPTLVDSVLAESCLTPSKAMAKEEGEAGRGAMMCGRLISRPPVSLLVCTQHPLAPPICQSQLVWGGGLTSWEEAVSGTNLFSPCFSSSRPKEKLSRRHPSSERLGASTRRGHRPTKARPEHLLRCPTILQWLCAVADARFDWGGVSFPYGRKGSLDTCSDSSRTNVHLTHGDSDQHSVR
jgi:hypothetical protein